MRHTVREVVLKNGLKGLVVHVPNAPVVSIEISFRAGEFLLDRDKWETSHLMEHLMLGANTRFKSSRIFQAELEKNGAYCNASTNVYDITYELECAHFEAPRVIGLVVEALSTPVFVESEFTAEYGNVLEELEGRSNNHFRTLNLALREAESLVGMSDAERLKRIENVTPHDVEQHYKDTHSTKNARIIIAGDITDEMLRLFDDLHLPADIDRIELPDETPILLQKPVIVQRSDVPNMYFYIDMFSSGNLSDRQKDTLHLISTLLTETLHSKLLGAAREQGLVYAMGSGQQQLKNFTGFWLGAQVSKKNAHDLFALTNKVLSEVAEKGVTKEELMAAKQYIRGRHERGAQTVAGTAARYAHSYFHDDHIQDEAHFNERLESITSKDVHQTMQALLGGNAWAMGLLGSVTQQDADALHAKLSPMFAKTA